MANREEHMYVERGGKYLLKKRIVSTKPSVRQVVVSRTIQLLWLLTSVVLILLGIRFGLKLIGASAANEFAAFVYDVTSVFTQPFQTLVTTPVTENGRVFDVAAVVAAVVVLIVIWAVTSLIRILFSSAGSVRKTTTLEEQIK